ncbi:mechanosensitive ion channel family protein [Sinisalibacter aestuarii]|uniref:Mechanosensitive ion channel protein n=1 Tax=Sinisalibacter aestuarii TaxID=2949426 RepID=A0ABQ5LMZ2_9RHOB|nr:mechanosensitive ion channel domain-containing protein [Sinisalibacter aestuarii]GKY86340.1 mechanosensitive ion channel protein [Sinisalibacter aestuarii]
MENQAGPAPEDIALGLWGQMLDFLTGLMRPWNAYQVLIAIALIAAAYLAARILRPRWEAWLRSREGWPTWRMRLGVMINRRMGLILFVVLIWPLVWVMRELTWPSRTYLLAGIGELAFAWLVIALVTRFIGNAFLRMIVRTAGWIWVTISILGLGEDTVALLDGIAVNIGEIRLSLWMVVQAVAIIGALFAAARFIARNSTSRIRKNQDISPSMQVLMVKLLQVGLYGAAIFIGLKAVGVDLTGLAVLSGAIGVGLGFGLQKVVSNLVSGFILLLDKSIKPGDVISLGETFGWIEQMGARYVSVVTRDGREYLIPNEDLITGQVVNWSHTNAFVRLDIFFGTAYHNDPHLVRKVATEAAASVDRVLSFRPPVCHIVNFGDSSVDYILRFWIDDPTGGLTNIRGNVYLALWDAFKANGVDIPFPQREVRLLGENEPTR